MYAIIQTGGKQERVSVGDILTVELLPDKKDVVFREVLLVSDGDKIAVGQPFVKGAEVKAQILGEIRGKKSISFKYRRRKSSKRIHGHRQELSRIKITDIIAG
jgi:large subunit ribosomal protein L21